MACISEQTRKHCSCSNDTCDKHGNCCKCVAFHRERGDIPGCFFSADGERSYDRSLLSLARDRGLL